MRYLGSSPRRPLGVLLLAATLAVLLQGTILPHTHDAIFIDCSALPSTRSGVAPGLYNGEHDLALLALLHGVAVAGDTVSAPLVVVAAPVAAPTPDRAASAPRDLASSRAPPAA